jgi:hypothetical protein
MTRLPCGQVAVVEVEVANQRPRCRRPRRSGAVFPPPIRLQSGAPPNSATCCRTRRGGSPSSAPIAQPRASRVRILNSSCAASQRSS